MAWNDVMNCARSSTPTIDSPPGNVFKYCDFLQLRKFIKNRIIFSPFYSEKCKYVLERKNVFGVIGTLKIIGLPHQRTQNQNLDK